MIGSPVQVHQTTDILRLFEESAIAAGRVILDIYRAGANVRLKGDASPVTEADERAEAVIVRALETLAPGVPVVAVASLHDLLAFAGESADLVRHRDDLLAYRARYGSATQD